MNDYRFRERKRRKKNIYGKFSLGIAHKSNCSLILLTKNGYGLNKEKEKKNEKQELFVFYPLFPFKIFLFPSGGDFYIQG